MRRLTTLSFVSSCALVWLFASSAYAQVTVNTFEGIDASSFQGAGLNVDPNGVVGTKQFMEWVNPVYWGFSKTPPYTPVTSTPVDGSTPWRGKYPDCVGTSGNGELIFDKLASRWVIGRRQGGTKTVPGFYYCIAVSNTDDLTAANFKWYAYEFALDPVLTINGVTYYPDYPKISTWPDAYYVTIDLENPVGYAESGIVACAFDRTNMITGGVMRAPQCFSYPKDPGPLFLAHSLLPADFDGTNPPPTGAPEVFLSIENPEGSNTTSNTMNEWQFHVDWTTPSNSTFTGPTTVRVPTYTQGCYDVSLVTNTVCVPEPSTPQTNNYIDSVGDRLMQRLTYRNFTGSNPYQSWVVSQTIQVGTGAQSQTGLKWFELRSPTAVYHSGTIKLSGVRYGFMPSAAQNKNADLAVGYSVSSTVLHPSISTAYLNLQSHLSPTTLSLWGGQADEENSFHWGVYTEMSVDPSDDCTFWYVNEYFDVTQLSSPTWQTRISNFLLPDCK